ncbi:hypothetical protein DOE73_09935, partial [Paenibacillus dendritiformis]
MKRMLTVFLAALIFIVSFPMSPVSASSVDVLRGLKASKGGLNLVTFSGNIGNATDGNDSSYFETYRSTTNVTMYSFVYELPSPVNIDSFRIKMSDYTRLYSKQPILFTHKDGSTKIYPTSNDYSEDIYLKGVTQIRIAVDSPDSSKTKFYTIEGISGISPNAPLNLEAVGGNKKVDLSWNAVENAQGYNIMRSEVSGGPYTVTNSVYGSTYTDYDVVNGVTYYYVVTAFNNNGESKYSNEASATPFDSGTEPETPDSDRAMLTITLTTGLQKEYDLSMDEVNAFITWY